MGSLCGSSTNTTTQNQTSTNTPAGLQQLQDIYGRVQQAASSPYTPYTGQQVAGLSGTQQAGIQGITNAQGAAQPYFDQATQYATAGAAPISAADIARYQSPYTQQVIDATKANFQQDNAIGQQQVVGNAALKGALGGDRVGVAKAELARQQGLAQNPVIAGLYNQGYTQALGAAQQDRAAQAQGAYTFGALAPSVQNAQISGAQAQIGAGGLEQGTNQAALTAQYNDYLRQQAFPYQQAGFLASAGLPAVTSQGGTTTGAGTTTTPGPNPWVQAAGLATAALMAKDGGRINGYASGGMVNFMDEPSFIPKFGGVPSTAVDYGRPMQAPPPPKPTDQTMSPQAMTAFGKGISGISGRLFGGDTPTGYTGNTDTPFSGIPDATTSYMGGVAYPMFSRGGAVNPRHARFHETVHAIRQTLRGGGRVGYAAGGDVDGQTIGGRMAHAHDRNTFAPTNYDVLPMATGLFRTGVDRLRQRAGYAGGGGVVDLSPSEYVNQGFGDAQDAVSGGTFDPQGANALGPMAFQAPQQEAIPLPRPRPEGLGGPYARADLPPIMTDGMGEPDLPDGAMAFTRPKPSPYASPDGQTPDAPEIPPTPGEASAADPARKMGGFNLFNLSDDARMALMSAGLGVAASRSPFALSAIGEGGLQGVKTYADQKEQRQKIDSEARRLAQTASQFAQNLGLHKDQLAETVRNRQETLAETKRHREMTEALTKEQRDQQALTPITIGMTPQGVEIKGIRDPKSGGYRIIDATTGKLLPVGEGLPGAPKPPGTYIEPSTGKPISQNDADGVIPANAQLVSSSVPYDYSTDAPYIEKGMDVPKPGPVAGKSSTAIQTDAENYLQTGKLPPVARGKSPVAIQQNNYRNAVQNYAGSLAQSRGLSPEQTADMWRTAPGMLRFILGADGRATVALGTAVRHLDSVQELAKAWAANDTQGINRIRAVIARQFGSEAGTNLEAAGKIVGPEIIKALGVAGAGTEKDRNDAAAQFSTASSPAQLKGAVDTVQRLLGGQLEGKKRQAAQAGVSEERFKGLIGERPYEILSHAEKGATPPSAPAAPSVKSGTERITQSGFIYEKQPDGSYKAVGKAP